MSTNTIPQYCRHVAVDAADSPLHIATGAVPTPHADEILIQVAAAGINRADLLQRAGLYPPPEDASPVLGLEVAGTVVATGDSVEDCIGISIGGSASASASDGSACRSGRDGCGACVCDACFRGTCFLAVTSAAFRNFKLFN